MIRAHAVPNGMGQKSGWRVTVEIVGTEYTTAGSRSAAHFRLDLGGHCSKGTGQRCLDDGSTSNSPCLVFPCGYATLCFLRVRVFASLR